ncbi:RNA-binding S4 domain-containing protein [Zoogloea sp.]|jgi:ribosome-associated heat shock protein Hsp15|uniref:RNA-binding S4 domain-containing protein n=2 Tax=Zoogloea sp. TaxID=49181 RepID=UPI0011D554AB|nr:RNA-binding S4 domain-containing protein [Zoogloea sp.]MBK6656562.1 RNA-binding S4 domain-containing protein [Zoogloea sp.]MBK7846130.1 RNA-binding S4 domain-containing protein [Zoogloea sp.]MBP7443969.1 RNA-binding S4 domain-containing protein [Zoogloea sp.]TXG95542.1 MAG: RNA-binding S4 domain-containing protein [Zoogloea sp.]
MKPTEDHDARVRLDKWLWAARFFKHRTQATEAVDGGKIQLNGIRVKPARDVKIGDRIDIQIAETHFCVMVKGIADKRGSAPMAQALYEETAESSAARAAAREQHKLSATPGADLHGRPTKRDRRQIGRMMGGD